MIKAMIFDLDGTICDTLDDITDAINVMLCAKRFPTLTRDDTLNNINNGAFELVRRSLPAEHRINNDLIRECLSMYSEAYSKCYDNKSKPYEGMTKVIQELKKRGLKLAVLSNKQDQFVNKIIAKIFPEGLFDLVIGDGHFPTKPDPKSANYICRAFGVLPQECAIIGDSHVDMQTAVNAGLMSVGVSWGYRPINVLIDNGAKIIIQKAEDLFDIIES